MKIIVIISIIILSAGLFYWWRNPQIFNKRPALQSPSNVLGKTSLQKIPQNIINDLVENTKDALYNNTQNALAEVFDQKNASSKNDVTVVVNPATKTDNILLIDFSKENNLQIKISKNSKYQLKFKNTPLNFCLYIDQDKYEINDDKTIELQFARDGSYAVKANLCDLKDLNLGQIIVE